MTGQRTVGIFTSMHPIDDVRVATKFAASFLDAGFKVRWIGPRVVAHGTVGHDERVSFCTLPAPRSRAGRFATLARLLVRALRARDVDWWYVPDPDAAFALSAVRRLLRGRIIFDVHEVFHTGHMDTWVGSGRLNFLREVVRRMIRRAGARSDLLIGVSDAVIEPYRSPSTPSLVVANYAPRWFASPGGQDDSRASAPVRFFHGKLVPNNGSRPVLEGFELMRWRTAAASELVVLDVGHPAFATQAARWSADHSSGVRVLPRRPHSEMPAVMRSCHVGLIAYGRDLGAASYPNRLFEYMAAGIAVLAPHYSPLIAATLEKEQIGRTADFEDPEDIARALRWFVEHPDHAEAMGARARDAFLSRYSWQHEFDQLTRHMRDVERGKL